MDNPAIMRQARESLRGKWGLAIGTFVIYILILGIPGSLHFPESLISLIIAGPFALGAAGFSLVYARRQEARLEMIFDGFKNFATALAAYLLAVLYVVLYALLLIIPGIIAALSYSMIFFILSDEPGIKAEEALRKSKKMMDGRKMQLFGLCMRLFLLALLCLLTLGIGFFWLIPYANVTMATFYESIRSTAEN